jgi:hypothetical protein
VDAIDVDEPVAVCFCGTCPFRTSVVRVWPARKVNSALLPYFPATSGVHSDRAAPVEWVFVIPFTARVAVATWVS